MAFTVAVFPLNEMVFFPSCIIPLNIFPLNIFEPRYVEMMNDSLESGRPVALTHINPLDTVSAGDARGFASSPQSIVGIGEPVLLERRNDKTLVILLRGLARARLGKIIQERPYVICEAEMLQDNDEVRDESRFFYQRLQKILGVWIEGHIDDQEHKVALKSQLVDPKNVVETFALYQVADVDLRQAILEMPDINDRIRVLSSAIVASA